MQKQLARLLPPNAEEVIDYLLFNGETHPSFRPRPESFAQILENHIRNRAVVPEPCGPVFYEPWQPYVMMPESAILPAPLPAGGPEYAGQVQYPPNHFVVGVVAMPEAPSLALSALGIRDVRSWRPTGLMSRYAFDVREGSMTITVTFGAERRDEDDSGDDGPAVRSGRALMRFQFDARCGVSAREIWVYSLADGRDELVAHGRMTENCGECGHPVHGCVCRLGSLPSPATTFAQQENINSWKSFRDWFSRLHPSENDCIEGQVAVDVAAGGRTTQFNAMTQMRPSVTLTAPGLATVQKCYPDYSSPAVKQPTTLQPGHDLSASRRKVSLRNLLADASPLSEEPNVETSNIDVLCNVAIGAERSTKSGAVDKRRRPDISSPAIHVCTECGTKFGRKSNLTRHFRGVHLGLRPFSCKLCPKSFQLKQHLQFHEKTVHEKAASSFSCGVCNSQLRSQKDLQKHQEVVHGLHTSTS